MKLRFYQREAIDAVRAAQQAGLQRVMIVLPTGAGKTVVMSAIPRFCLPRPTDATVIVVNRDELVAQTVDKLVRTDPGAAIAIEKAGKRAVGTERYVVASVQTLRGPRLDDFFTRFAGRIGLMQIDECHHAVARGYRDVADRLFAERDDALLFGVTATPQRADGVGLAAVFKKIVYSRDIRWAIDEGMLVRPRCYRIDTAVSLDAVPIRMGDFAPEKLNAAVDIPDRNDVIVSAYRRHTPGMRAIVFCTSVAHARHLCAKFRDAGVRAEWSSGKVESISRKAKVDAFRRGQIDVLVNCSLYLEGFDVPEARVLVNARPTKSRALLVQMVGRVLRPLDDVARELGNCATSQERAALIAQSAKPDAIILDVVDQVRVTGLETIPTLWGLPPKMNLEGGFLDEVAVKVGKIRAKDPTAETLLSRAVDVDVALHEISAWDTPKRDESVPTKAQYDWRSESEGRWVLDLPVGHKANYPDGTPVENFSRRFANYLAEHRTRGVDVYEVAARAIGHDPASVQVVQESFSIELEADKYVVRLTSYSSASGGGPGRTLGSDPMKNEAFYRCEQWIENNRRDIVSAISSRASWKSGPPKSKAIKKLVELGVPLNRVPATSGDVFALASKIAHERGTVVDMTDFDIPTGEPTDHDGKAERIA